MQIHELNSFNGELNSGAYVVVDNGSDTGKVPIPRILEPAEDEIAAANARIDNIISSPAPSEAEIIDARLGADGVTYPSLGKAIRNQFNRVKNDLDLDTDFLIDAAGKITITEFNWISNSYVTQHGVITPYNGWHRTDYIDVSQINRVYLYATSGSNTQLYNCWYDADKTFISNFLCNNSQTEYIPPANAKYFILSTSDSNNVQLGTLSYDIDQLTKNMGFDAESVPVLNSITNSMAKEGFEWIDDSYVTQSGVITPYAGWHRTDYIDIDGADQIYLFASSGSNTQTFNCWYDENKTFISNFLCNRYITDYTPPANAKYFILSTSQINTVTQGTKTYSLGAIKSNLGINEIKPVFTYRGSLDANDFYDTRIGIAPKIGFMCGMFAKLSAAFDSITIQLDAYSPNQIIVDDTNVTLKYRYGTDVVLAHGITIADDVSISVVMDNPSTIDVTVGSKGTKNTVTGSFSVTAYETLQILNGSQALTDIVFTIGCTTINHNVWVFGDSYLGMNNNARWAYYLNDNGYTKNVMLCGSTGSGRVESTMWLDSLLQIGTPKKIVWCMGMNYSSDGSAPASGWLTQLQDVIGICESNGIELILATIPTVPTINHEQKNAYVRSSGYRYIDFAMAVGAQSDGTWYTGMLSGDNIHPTTLGAVALYNMAIASVPELAYDYN